MKQLADTFGIQDNIIEKTSIVKAPEPKQLELIPFEQSPSNKDQIEDYILSRKTFKKLISKGEDAIDELYALATSSEHPRSYEVLATLMKTVADTTRDLYDLQKKTKDLAAPRPEEAQGQGNINVDKAVFVGTTSDILKQIKNNNDENI